MLKALCRIPQRSFVTCTQLSCAYANSYCYRTPDNVIKSKKTVEMEGHHGDDLYTFLSTRMKEHGDKLAMVDALTDARLSFNQILHNSAKLSSYLEKQGYGGGDCIAVHSANCLEYSYPILAALQRRSIFTTTNPSCTSFELNKQLIDANVKLLFANSKNIETARKAVHDTNVEQIILIGDVDVNDSGILNLSDVLDNEREANSNLGNRETDVAFYLYSSGTTGLPKGVMLTHTNVSTNILQLLQHMNNSMEERHLCFLPFYHSFGLLVCLLKTLYYGCTLFVLPGFEPTQFLSAIEKYQIERLTIVPPVAVFMAHHALTDKYDLTSVENVDVGAAPIDQTIVNAISSKFPKMALVQGYGMTEASPVSHFQQMERKLRKAGSAGVPLPSTESKVICLETGKAVGVSEKGEVWLRGPQVMKGYLNNPEATANTITEDGWLKTGDLGFVDAEHNVFIVDRIKELIKYKAFQVAPAELEDVLLGHPEIIDCCVIGIPDERAGELPRAYLVACADSDVTDEDIHEFLRERVSDHKKLRGGVAFVDKLPKSATGKLLRRVLKEEFKNLRK